jgi:hypothetical protein
LSPTEHILKKTPDRVRVVRRHHPLEGQDFEVSFGDGMHLVILLKDGSTMRMLRAWTDADGPRRSDSLRSDDIFTAEALRQLIAVVEGLQQGD